MYETTYLSLIHYYYLDFARRERARARAAGGPARPVPYIRIVDPDRGARAGLASAPRGRRGVAASGRRTDARTRGRHCARAMARGTRGARRCAKRALVLACAVRCVGGAPAATCAYGAAWAACARAGRAEARDARGTCARATGDGICLVGSDGVRFARGDRGLVSEAREDGSAGVRAIASGGRGFTVEAVAIPDARAPDAGTYEPIVAFSASRDETTWRNMCGASVGGFYLAIWIHLDRVGLKMRAPHAHAAFRCTSDTSMYHPDIAPLARGSVNVIAVTYGVEGIAVAVNGTRTFPLAAFGADFALEPGGDAARVWNASNSRIVIGAYGEDAFSGVIQAVNIYDYVLNERELLEAARMAVPNSKPRARDVNVTCAEDESTRFELHSDDAEGDAARFRILSLPMRGRVYDDTDGAEIVVVPYDLVGSTVRFAPTQNEHSVSSAADERYEYASFEFDAHDDETNSTTDTTCTYCGVVKVRVLSVNDEPTSSDVSVMAYAGVPKRVQLPFSDVDDADGSTSIVIIRAPTFGMLASCDNSSSVLLDNSTINVSGAPCVEYVVVDPRFPTDSFEYIITDAEGGRSAPATATIAIKTPCVLLDRRQTIEEDRTAKIGVVAACVVSRATLARVMSPPLHGDILSDNVINLETSACSSAQNILCEEWWVNISSSSPSCACGTFDYLPNRDYFNVPAVDVYGQEISLNGTSAASWALGTPDSVNMTIQTLDGWSTEPYAMYISVKNVFDAPTIRVHRHVIDGAGVITPNTTSFVLSGAIDIDIAPDYDVHAISVTLSSPYARILELRDARFDWLVPPGGGDARILRLAGSASAVADALRRATIAYMPRDANIPATEDRVKVRIAVGLRTIMSTPCEIIDSKRLCYFQSTASATSCTSDEPPSLPCVIETQIPIALADAPSYVAAVSESRRRQSATSRSLSARARAVFFIWFTLGAIVFWFISKCAAFARMRNAGAFGF